MLNCDALNSILPVRHFSYFRHGKVSSFYRQLNIYDFQRVLKGPDEHSYYHKYFVRDQPELLRKIERKPIKGNGTDLATCTSRSIHGQLNLNTQDVAAPSDASISLSGDRTQELNKMIAVTSSATHGQQGITNEQLLFRLEALVGITSNHPAQTSSSVTHPLQDGFRHLHNVNSIRTIASSLPIDIIGQINMNNSNIFNFNDSLFTGNSSSRHVTATTALGAGSNYSEYLANNDMIRILTQNQGTIRNPYLDNRMPSDLDQIRMLIAQHQQQQLSQGLHTMNAAHRYVHLSSAYSNTTHQNINRLQQQSNELQQMLQSTPQHGTDHQFIPSRPLSLQSEHDQTVYIMNNSSTTQQQNLASRFMQGNGGTTTNGLRTDPNLDPLMELLLQRRSSTSNNSDSQNFTP